MAAVSIQQQVCKEAETVRLVTPAIISSLKTALMPLSDATLIAHPIPNLEAFTKYFDGTVHISFIHEFFGILTRAIKVAADKAAEANKVADEKKEEDDKTDVAKFECTQFGEHQHLRDHFPSRFGLPFAIQQDKILFPDGHSAECRDAFSNTRFHEGRLPKQFAMEFLTNSDNWNKPVNKLYSISYDSKKVTHLGLLYIDTTNHLKMRPECCDALQVFTQVPDALKAIKLPDRHAALKELGDSMVGVAEAALKSFPPAAPFADVPKLIEALVGAIRNLTSDVQLTILDIHRVPDNKLASMPLDGGNGIGFMSFRVWKEARNAQ